MEKLSYLYGEKCVPNVWQPCHVLEIIGYLKSRGYSYELYKEMDSSKFILVNKNAVLFFRKASELCESLCDLYFKEKQEEEVEYYQKRALRDKKNNVYIGGILK